jgi:hypothetical protein
MDLPLGASERSAVKVCVGHQDIDRICTETGGEQFNDSPHTFRISLMRNRVVAGYFGCTNQVRGFRKRDRRDNSSLSGADLAFDNAAPIGWSGARDDRNVN